MHVFSIATASSAPAITGRQLWKIDCTSGAVALTLPDATLCPRAHITAVKVDAGANAASIVRAGTQTILGTAGAAQTSLALATQGKSFTLVSDGSNWIVVGAV